MSIRASARVWDGSTHSGSEKLMLLAIADHADDDGRAYPSIATLATKCGTKPRYAMVLLDALVSSGELVVLKGQGPVGRGGRTNLYRIVFDKLTRQAGEVANQSTPVHQGAVVHAGAPVNQGAPVHPGAESSEPEFREVVHQGSPKPSENHQEPRDKKARERAGTVVKPDEVAQQVWADWVALRKAKRAPVTETVLQEARGQAAKAAMPLEAFLRIWCARGSQGLQADWLKPQERLQPRPAGASKHAGFDTKNYRDGVTEDGRLA